MTYPLGARAQALAAPSLALLLAASAAHHVLNPRFYAPVVPPSWCSDQGGPAWLPRRSQWVLGSAVPEAMAAAGLLLPVTRRAAATATAVMFAAFTAGHVSALRHAYGPAGTAAARRVHALRLPLQLPLVVWAWRARRA